MNWRSIVVSLFVALLSAFLPLAAQSSFDRIRIVITSSSDWTILQLRGHERITNLKGVPLQGASDYRWSYDSLGVNQPIANALDGQSVIVQFDILLQSNTAGLIDVENTKGNIGVVQMDFYQFNTSVPELVTSVRNINTSGHPNPKTFTVDAALLLEGNLQNAPPQSSIPRLILAFYYPWYALDSWRSPALRDWPIVPYSSDDISVISHHVELAKQAGIDGFISSWWGPNSDTDENLQKLLAASEDMDFKVSIYFETLTGEPARARPEDEILSWLRYFLQTYGQDKRFLQLDGKPVIFVWASAAVPLDVWREVFDTLRAEDLDAIYMANTLEPDNLGSWCISVIAK